MNNIELRPAYVWTCDECGMDNFCYGVVPSQEILEECGFEIEEGSYWIQMPDEVICQSCSTCYRAESYDG